MAVDRLPAQSTADGEADAPVPGQGEARGRRSGYREKNSTADRALDILAMFSPVRLRVTAVDVAEELSVARSTAYRYLMSLSSAGYLEEDPASGFRLGLKVFELARIARSSYGLSSIALPVLRGLCQTVGETVLLTRRVGPRVVCLEKEEPPGHQIRMSYERGSVFSLNAGASAWVLLAWEDSTEVDRLLVATPLESFTPGSITTADAVRQRLARVRDDGFSVTRGELDPDAIGIAAPVRDDQARVVAGVSVVALGKRIPTGREREVVDQVLAAADEVSRSVALNAQ